MNETKSFWEDAIFVGPDDVHECNEANMIAQDRDTINNIRSWLRPTDFDGEGSEYQKHLSSYLPGTGAWVQASPIYQQWYKSSEHGLLWVRGIPGSGKSVLAAKLVHELSQEQVPVLYFFFRQIVDANHRPRAALQDLLTQVLPYSPPLQLELKTYLGSSKVERKQQESASPRDLDSLSMPDLWQHLRIALSHLSKAYLIVDALDEMDQGHEAHTFVQHLSELATWKPSQVKVLLTSRPIASLERLLLSTALLRLRLAEESVDQDIDAYVQDRLVKSTIPPQLHGPIRAAVPGRANGLFLYAKLAMDALLKQGVDVPQALGEIPDNLDQMYTRLLVQHAAQSEVSMEVQQLIMRWITHSVRPLRLIEMADMLSHQHISSNVDLSAAKQVLRSACGSLLELLPDETLSVVHHSLTEFLTGETRSALGEYPILESAPTHHVIARICLAYLQNGCLEDAERQSPPDHVFFARPPAGPLLAPFTTHAAMNWSTHVVKSGNHDTAEMNVLIDQFTTHAHFQKWACVTGLRKAGKEAITPMFMAISLGLSEYLQYLLTQPSLEMEQGAPIVHAAAKGYTDVVDLLLRRGASPDQYDAEGFTALHRAAMNNHPAIAALLLEAGCNINLTTKEVRIDCTFERSEHLASWFACAYGHADVLAELQRFMTTSQQLGDALTVAVQYKRTDLVRRLLQHPYVQLNSDESDEGDAESDDESTHYEQWNAPLVLACDNRDLDTIELLLSSGANANKGALHALARSKAVVDADILLRCFSSIIQAGANLEAPDRGDNTGNPLQQAADATAARILLAAGADVEAENRDGETPLFTCADADVLKVLVEVGGADLEKRNRDGETPLLASMRSFCVARKEAPAIMALIDLGADVNAVDQKGNGVFHFAIEGFYSGFPEGLIERLCAAGADINRPNSTGSAPIHLTKIEIWKSSNIGAFQMPKQISRFEVLTAAGARLTPTAADSSRNPLFKWISDSITSANDSKLSDVMETLLQFGASLDIRDDNGRTLLHEAVKGSGHKTHIQSLLDRGLDPRAVDKGGNTLWHEAASHLAGTWYGRAGQPVEPFEQLVQIGVDPMQLNKVGRTALHVLSSLWPRAIHAFKSASRPSIGSGHINVTTAFDFTLCLSSQVDIPDKDGVTPLHLAATFCEYLVGRLLSKGADPSRLTVEGCNALHIAARANMPNIVAMLLSSMRSKSVVRLESAVGARDHLGRGPLYYACLTGSYESTKMLVEAGATVNTENYLASPWRAVARVEVESTSSISSSYDSTVGAVLIAHDNSPKKERYSYHMNYRMDELLALLVANTTNTLPIIDQSILDAAALEADYTVERLLQVREAALPGDLNAVSPQVIASIDRRRVEREKCEKPCKNCSKVHCESPAKIAWFMSDYRLLPNALLAESNGDRIHTLRRLVSDGHASVLQGILALGGPQALDDRPGSDPCNIQKQFAFPLSQAEHEPLLLRACRRSVPNLDLIRVLVEQAEHNIDVQQHISTKPDTYYEGFSDSGRYIEGESVLHALVRGEHWWNVHEGLRYFLERGANTELRDVHGMTPLSAALDRCGWLIFDKHTVELLVEHGADVNAVDRSGHSCLAKACSDPEMTKLLLDRGAIVTQGVFIQAIELKDVQLLSLLLSRGGDPNVCGESKRPGWTSIAPVDRYPLHFVILGAPEKRQVREVDPDLYKKMIRVLLDHGADPCAAYESTTILHELVRAGEDLTLLLTSLSRTSTLDVRNAAGETPLHLVCQKTGSQIRTADGQNTALFLVSSGASPRARDSKGNSIWHMFARTGANGYTDEELESLLALAPDLVTVPNDIGELPLHIAMGHVSHTRILELLLDNSDSATLHAVDAAGNSLLHYLLRNQWHISASGVIEGDTLTYFRRLLSAGLDINSRNSAGETPIFSFFRHGWVMVESQRASLFGGASSKAHTVFVTASASAHHTVHDLFATAGVDWHASNASGQTLLHVITNLPQPRKPRNSQEPRMQHPGDPIWKFRALLERGLDKGAEDVEGRTPVDVAVALGCDEILELVREWGCE